MIRPSFIIGMLLIGSGSLGAEDSVLPSDFKVSRYSAIWEDSPFNREVVARRVVAPAIAQSNFGKEFVLEGLVTNDSAETTAYLRNLNSDDFLVVSSEQSLETDLYVVEAKKSANPAETFVTVTDGSETARIGFPTGVLTAKIRSPVPPPPQPQGTPPTNPADQPPNTDENGDSETAAGDAADAEEEPKVLVSPKKPPARAPPMRRRRVINAE